MVLLRNEAQVEAHFGLLGDSANIDADRCTICAKCTIGSEIVLDAPDGTPRCVGHVESLFDPFGDGVNVGARLVHGLRQTYHGSEIILDAPDGTPR